MYYYPTYYDYYDTAIIITIIINSITIIPITIYYYLGSDSGGVMDRIVSQLLAELDNIHG